MTDALPEFETRPDATPEQAEHASGPVDPPLEVEPVPGRDTLPGAGTRPNAMIIGAAKCGTTTLFHLLSQHPQVFSPAHKEPYFFGGDFDKRMGWAILDEAGYRRAFEGAERYPVALEGSTLYFYSQAAPAEMHAFNPDMKLIMMLRDPVRYIHSLHRHFVRSLNEPEAMLEKALAMEDDRAAGRVDTSGSYFPQGLHYQRQAYFAQHARRYIDVFGRERIGFWLLDDLGDDPLGVFAQVCRHLGVDDGVVVDTTAQNVDAQKSPVRNRFIRRWLADKPALRKLIRHSPVGPRRFIDGVIARFTGTGVNTRAPMPTALRDRLREQYREDVADLSEIVGRDLAELWWGKGGEG